MIRCKITESLQQAGNDKTTSLREHTCKVKWDGLYSKDKVSNKSHQHGQGKITHHEQSTGKETTKAVPVWLHQELTSYLKGFSCGTCY